MKDFVHLFDGRLSRRQVRTRVERFVENRIIDKEGEGQSTLYKIGKKYIENFDVVSVVVNKALKKSEKKNDWLILNDQEMTKELLVNPCFC